MTFAGFVHKYILKNKATSNMKIQQAPSSLFLNDTGSYLGNGLFSSDIGVVNFYPSKGTLWICYKNEKKFFDSNGYTPPIKLSRLRKKRSGYSL